jgi:hypothetical protein
MIYQQLLCAVGLILQLIWELALAGRWEERQRVELLQPASEMSMAQ